MKKRILSFLIAIVMVMGTIPFTIQTANAVSFESTRTDFRDESVYTLLVNRFYDGDTGNNVLCWNDAIAGNPESDPAWRGDFKGLVEKLDYIKALGFTAIRLNPVVQNASGYDYHGEHPIDLMDIDFRLESEGFTYIDLVDACHARGMKIMQNVILNSTSSYGEKVLGRFFDLDTEAQWSVSESMIPNALLLEEYPNYESMNEIDQFNARIDLLRKHTNGNYHTETDMGYDSSLQHQGTVAVDCVDINTENPFVAFYLATSCVWYAEMGVDAICILGAEYINRWTLNEGILPEINSLLEEKDLELEIFYELVARDRATWNQNNQSISVPFYSWAETEAAWQGNFSDINTAANIQKSIEHFNSYGPPSNAPISNNAFLSGLSYHTPDYSKSNGMHAFDFNMLWNFQDAESAYTAARNSDKYMNDATWNLMSVDSIDYAPEGIDKTRYSRGSTYLKNNLNLMFTFRGIPSVLYGSEIEFKTNVPLDAGLNAPLEETGRAYYGEYLEGTLNVTDFGVYTATGNVSETLSSSLSRHIRSLNAIRMNVPALRKGQYTVDGSYVSGTMAFIRRYTSVTEGIDSLALVTIKEGATFKNIPNGKYINAVTGEIRNVTNGTLTISAPSSGDGGLAIYVCCATGFTGIEGRIEAGSGSKMAYNEASPTLSFSANGGSGKMSKLTSDFVLPECTFTPPAGAEFLGWSVNGTIYQPGDNISIPVDSMARAIWSGYSTPDASNFYTVSVSSNNTEYGSGTGAGYYKLGSLVTLRAVANTGYAFTGWTENGKLVSMNETYTFAAIKDRSLVAHFAYDEQPEEPGDADTPVTPDSYTIYFRESYDMDLVKYYVWSPNSALSTWPGLDMTSVDDTLWKCEVPSEYINIIFNDGSGWQTSDLLIPKDGKNLYDRETETWSVYGDVVVSPTPDPTPDEPVGDRATTFYFQYTGDIDQVYFYIWSDESSAMSSWPGEKMTYVGLNIWKCNVPLEADYIIFNNNSGWQTNDLTIPTNGKNLYNIDNASWSVYNPAIETQDSASIRLSSKKSGLRFKTHIKSSLLEDLVEKYGAQSVYVGTLIAPADLLGKNELTHQFGTVGVNYIDVVANIASPFGVKGNTRIYAGSIVNIREENLERDFMAVGYIKIVDGDNVDYIYSSTSCVRNVSDVATAAYNDIKDTADDEYKYEVVGDGDVHIGKYSPYTESHRTILCKFFAKESDIIVEN